MVYVGSAGGIDSKRMLAPLLRETVRLHALSSPPSSSSSFSSSSSSAAAADGEGYAFPPLVPGMGWQGFPEFEPYWKGVLPHARGALGQVYGAAAAVLGATMDGQRNYGMVNNRVFEVLASGAFLCYRGLPRVSPGPSVRAHGGRRRCRA